ncbi:MFS transporter [Flammeovirga aprica]|uniref:Sugar MFS transporter n=1 Tax=Flammeovirga aprica JL-4 TaxID=694437 RepID=A0A7X9RU66_9BACT|nr:MFS transporter [Flammeovirga aprica]NME68778.1 sugar MFS transporter [Flammeovirga aprica JL-4]
MNSKVTSTVLPVLFGFFVMGFCDVVGITVAHVKEDLLVDYSKDYQDTLSNLIPVALFSMFLIFSIPTGILMTKIGRKKTVLLSNIITVFAMFIPLIEYSFEMALVAFALLGIANTILQVSLNPLLSNVVSGDQLTSSLTAGQFVKAISSFTAPFIAAFAASYFNNWQYIFPIYAVITLVSTIWLYFAPIEETISTEKASSFGQVLGLLKDKTIALLFLGILFVVGVDVGINTAAPKILMERCGLTSIEAGYGPSVYFALRTLGAFMGAFILAKLSPAKFFKISMVIAVAGIVALLFVETKIGIFALYGLIGFFIANIFAIIFGMAMQVHPDKANEISGLMITGVFGGAIIPFAMGLLSDAMHSQMGAVIIILGSAAYLLMASFTIKIKQKASSETVNEDAVLAE